MEMLCKLRAIRDVMTTTGRYQNVASLSEISKLREENDSLKEQNTRQEYRITHLVRAVELLQLEQSLDNEK